jgi:pimeloyl-ACP methyl ester carboxylesterase
VASLPVRQTLMQTRLTPASNTAAYVAATVFKEAYMSDTRSYLMTAAALLALSGTAVAKPRPDGAIQNIVITHGAFVDGSGWRAVHDILEKDGYRVTIVQEPLTSLADDVAATKRVLDLQDGHVVLVGHSYGGSVISIAGTDPKVSRLVFVAALQPDVGETAGQLLSKFPDRNKAAQPAGKGYLRLDPAKFAATFAADVAPAEARFMADSQVPLAASVFSTPTTEAAWRTKPSFAILTAHDLAANPDLQRWEYERSGAKVTTVAASHAVYISHPKIVAHVIEEAAESSAPRTAKKVN